MIQGRDGPRRQLLRHSDHTRVYDAQAKVRVFLDEFDNPLPFAGTQIEPGEFTSGNESQEHRLRLGAEPALDQPAGLDDDRDRYDHRTDVVEQDLATG